MRENSRKIYVYENWSKDIPVKMGTLYADGNRGKEVYSFEYDISLILYFFYGSFKNASFFLFILQSVRPPMCSFKRLLNNHIERNGSSAFGHQTLLISYHRINDMKM